MSNLGNAFIKKAKAKKPFLSHFLLEALAPAGSFAAGLPRPSRCSPMLSLPLAQTLTDCLCGFPVGTVPWGAETDKSEQGARGQGIHFLAVCLDGAQPSAAQLLWGAGLPCVCPALTEAWFKSCFRHCSPRGLLAVSFQASLSVHTSVRAS